MSRLAPVAGDVPIRAPATLVELALDNAAVADSSTAYHFVQCDGDESLSYTDVVVRAQGIAAHLQRENLDHAPAVLLLPTGSAFVAAFFACAFAGVAAVPVAAPGTQAQLDVLLSIVQRSGAGAVISTRTFRDRLLARHASDDALRMLRWVLIDDCSDDPSAWRTPRVSPDTPALLQFTSGSTDRPRGVVVTHRNILANQQLIEQGFRHGSDAIVVGWLPLFHDMGLIGNMLNPFALRRPCVLMPPQAFLRTPRLWLDTIARFRATTSGGPNFAFELCAQRAVDAAEGLDLSSWRVAFVGAEPVRAATLQRFGRAFAPAGFSPAAFYPCYGLAEATLIVTGMDRGQRPMRAPVEPDAVVSRADATVACGAALGGQEVLVVDAERRVPCEDGTPGEIWVRGGCVAAGYHGDPDATRATFSAFLADGRGPFLRTGDVGVYLDGDLRLRGRLKNVIIVDGVNVFAEDVEGWLDRCDAALVAGGIAAYATVHDGTECLAVAAEVRRDALRTLDGAATADRLRQRAAELFDVPLAEVVLCKPATLPRTTSGKIQHWQCAAQLADADKVLHRSVVMPASARTNERPSALARDVRDITAWLRRGIARATAQPEAAISPTASFVHLGISSADALRLTVELGDALGTTFDDTLFWEYPSIAAVAVHVAGADE